MLTFYVIFVLLLIALFIISLLLRVYASFSYLYQDGVGSLQVEVKILGVKVFKKKVSHQLPELGEGEQMLNKMDYFYDYIKELLHPSDGSSENNGNLLKSWKLLRRFFSKVTIHTFIWKTTYGTGDAGFTGACYGLVWTFKQLVLQFVHMHFRSKYQPVLAVTPSFQEQQFDTQIECMVSVKVGQAMYAFLHLSKYSQGNTTTNSNEVWQT